MIQEIYIIDDDETSVLVFRELFKNDTEYKFISVKSEQIDRRCPAKKGLVKVRRLSCH